MKKLITAILMFTALALATQARSATIAGIENVTLLGGTVSAGCVSGTPSECASDYVTVSSTTTLPGATAPATNTSITGVLTDTPATYAPGDDFTLATYVVNPAPDAGDYLEFSFGTSLTNANDLVFFFFGGNIGQYDADGFTNSFDLDINRDGIFDTTTTSINHFIPLDNDGLATTVLDLDTFRTSGGREDYYTLTAATVDLSASGLISGQSLDSFRVSLANIGGEFTMLSGVGYIPAIAPIPLPLPIVLFASGLGVLGLFGRRKRQK